MESLRETLAAGFVKRIEKELGREATLRLLWPAIVGPQLAGNTGLKALRGDTLIVSVPDRVWLASLGPLEKMILDAVNSLRGERACSSIEFVIGFTGQSQKVPIRAAHSAPLRAVSESRTARASERSNRSPSANSGQALTVAAQMELDTGMIADEGLRALLLESARKYFAAQEDH